MTLVTWHVVDRATRENVSDAQITITAQPQGTLPFFRIDLFTDQFGNASADLMGSASGVTYGELISHPNFLVWESSFLLGSLPRNFTRSLIPSPTIAYTMTFQVSDMDGDKRNLNSAEIKSDINSSFFNVVTDGIGRATVTYGEDKVGDHRVHVTRPNYGKWEATVSFPAAAGFKGIQLSRFFDIIDDVPVIIDDKPPPTDEELDIAWTDMPGDERLATSILVALSIIYGMRALQGFSAARFKPI